MEKEKIYFLQFLDDGMALFPLYLVLVFSLITGISKSLKCKGKVEINCRGNGYKSSAMKGKKQGFISVLSTYMYKRVFIPSSFFYLLNLTLCFDPLICTQSGSQTSFEINKKLILYRFFHI